MTILSTPTKYSPPASASPSEPGVMTPDQEAASLNVHLATLRRKGTVLLAFLPLLLGDDLAGILDITISWIRFHAREIRGFQRLGACSSRFDTTGAKQ